MADRQIIISIGRECGSDGHDFMIDTSVFGIDGAVDIIIDLAERKFGKIA